MSDFFSKFICIYHKKAVPLQPETLNHFVYGRQFTDCVSKRTTA